MQQADRALQFVQIGVQCPDLLAYPVFRRSRAPAARSTASFMEGASVRHSTGGWALMPPS